MKSGLVIHSTYVGSRPYHVGARGYVGAFIYYIWNTCVTAIFILYHIDKHLNMMALARVSFTVLRATAEVLVLVILRNKTNCYQ